jgi:selenophosphate synthase
LAQALQGLKPVSDPRLLVGISTADDAGVFLLQDGLALVQTVDLLTPMSKTRTHSAESRRRTPFPTSTRWAGRR